MTTTQIQYWNMKENVRHNLVSENLTVKDLQIKSYNAKENKRHNLATENLTAKDISEKIRHNKKGENLTARELAIKQQDANTRSAALLETIEHNRQTERIQTSANTIQANYNRNKIKLDKEKNDIEHMFKSAKSVTDFANMLDNVGLSLGAKIYAVEELIMNPNISKDSKQELSQLLSKLYNAEGVGMTTKTAKDGKKVKTMHPNVEKKFKHH